MSLQDIAQRLKARGNFGHAGRPGKVGGSTSGSGGGGVYDTPDFKAAVKRARSTIAENGLSSGMVLYNNSGKINSIDTDTWLTGKLQSKFTKLAIVYSRRVEDASGKQIPE